MQVQTPPVLSVLNKILSSPCPNCHEKINSMKRIVNKNEGYICLGCEYSFLQELHQPNTDNWWSCDCGNCNSDNLERGYLYVCFECEVDIKAEHAGNNLNTPVKCNKCSNDMILFDFQY